MKRIRNSDVADGESSWDGGVFFRRFSEANIIGLITADEKRILTANDEFLRLIGYRRTDLQDGRLNWRKITPPEHLQHSLQSLKDLKQRSWCVPFEKEYYRKDGSRVAVLFGGARLARKPFACVCFVLDVTKRKLTEKALHQSQADLLEAQRVAKLGNWSFDIAAQEVRWSQELFRIFDVDKRSFKGLYQSFLSRVHPGDRPRVQQVNTKAKSDGKPFEVEYRIKTRTGELKTVRELGYARRNEQGKVAGLFGTAQDVTALKRAEAALTANEQRLRLALDAANAGTWSWEVAADASGWDDNYHRLYGFKPQEKKSFSAWINRVHPEDRGRLLGRIRALVKPGAENLWNEEFRAILPGKGERWMSGLGSVERDASGKASRMQGINLDITERKQTEAKLRRLNRTLHALSHSGRALLHATAEPAYLAEVCRIIVEDCGHRMVWVGFAEHDAAKTVRPAAHAGLEQGYLGKLQVSWADTERGRGPTGTAIRTGQVAQCHNMQINPAFKPWRVEAIKRGYRSSAAFPLAADGRTFGALTIYSAQPEGFDEEELRLLTELAGDVAMGLTTLRLRAAHAATVSAVRELNETLEQRVAERTATLRESEEKFHRLFSTVADAVILHEGATLRILEINDAACRMYGYARQELLGHSALLLSAEPLASKASIAGALAGRPERNPQRWHRKKDGTLFPVEVSTNTFVWEGQQLVCGIFRDITERKRMEQEILSISEREQRRIAQDLHDDLCQQLSGIQFLTHSLARSLADASRAECAEADKLAELLRRAIEKTRDLSRGLSPVELEADGLATAFRQLCVRVENMFLRKCVFHGHSFIPLPDPAAGIHLYRITQEAVSNAIKHGQASRIDITLAARGDKLILKILDNGRGFPPHLERPSGMGLRVMRYRASMLGGSLAVQQPASGGTEVVCSVATRLPLAKTRRTR